MTEERASQPPRAEDARRPDASALSPSRRAWRSFARHQAAVASAVLLVIVAGFIALWPVARHPAVSSRLPQTN